MHIDEFKSMLEFFPADTSDFTIEKAIDFFQDIPEEEWCVGYLNHDDAEYGPQHCAIGQVFAKLSKTPEAAYSGVGDPYSGAIAMKISSWLSPLYGCDYDNNTWPSTLALVNNGECFESWKFGTTPKARVVNALMSARNRIIEDKQRRKREPVLPELPNL